MKIKIYSSEFNYNITTLFDMYYVYKQYQFKHNGYDPGIEINFIESLQQDLDADCINIAYYYMPEVDLDFSKFDLVLLDNDHHGLEVATEQIYKLLDQKNCYLIAGAYLIPEHKYQKKVIYFPAQFISRDYYTRPVYPQYFENLYGQNTIKNKTMIYVNGQNRAHRQYFMDSLSNSLGTAIEYKNSVDPEMEETKECFFESLDDTQFRILVMDKYKQAVRNKTFFPYYDDLIPLGIKSKFGSMHKGFSLIDEYFTHKCVIFPESSWINDQLFLTEKINKCFLANTIPWPIGGANLNYLYNQLGFQTAWNLLPDNLKIFDQEKNHAKRIDLCVTAIQWMNQNLQVLDSKDAKKIVKNNRDLYHTSMLDHFSAVQLDALITRKWDERRH